MNILEAKNKLSQLIKSAQAGEEVVIANRGEPVARLVAMQAEGAATAGMGSAGALLGWLRNNPLPAHRRRSHKEIEAGIREQRAGWD